ncbi:SUN domain-containing protein 3-like isoform X2 [Sphaerodactylus townsendi]|uniref:SUN domain-containing protein 3-like isoform X2 n=1 Tax=Sphaerodactylus townsendi TaxID=933632 RepID=UPI0020267785|nr:SUN domain-containing protein 3-like isoform X2 [Sphaerodactylus townsendi]
MQPTDVQMRSIDVRMQLTDVWTQLCSKSHFCLLILAVLTVAMFAGLMFKVLTEQSPKTLDHLKNPATEEISGATPKLDKFEKIFRQRARGQIKEENFALKSSGASVVRCSKPFFSGAKLCMCGFCWNYSRSPDIILKLRNTPGNCWAMAGHQGYVVIKLSETISPTAVRIDHISKKASVFRETSSALRNFSIYEAEEGTLLGSFIFKTNTFSVQMFQLKRAKEDRFLYLMLMISSNYGHPKYTCVYGVRIYGQRAN